jgi:hypothetical protein
MHDATTDPDARRTYLQIEQSWHTLANSYAFLAQLEHFINQPIGAGGKTLGHPGGKAQVDRSPAIALDQRALAMLSTASHLVRARRTMPDGFGQ